MDKVPLLGVECVAGTVYVSDSVGDLLGLESLVRIEGFFEITGFDSPGMIASLQGLDNLKYAGGLKIVRSALQSLSGLESLEETFSTVSIYECPYLHDLTGLSSLHTIGGSLYLSFWWDGWGFPALQNLGDLQALRTIGLDLEIFDTSLTDLDELAGLETVGGNGNVFGNTLLPTCKAKALLETAGVGGSINYENNMPDACSP